MRMNEEIDLPKMPGYVSIKEAAKLLGISGSRVYDYVEEGRLPAVRSAHVIMIPIDEVQKFKPSISGRPRKHTPSWRKSLDENRLIAKSIVVQMKAGQQAELLQKLDALRQGDEYMFPGTLSRSIARSNTVPGRVEIELVWRISLMPDEAEFEQQFKPLRQLLNDVLDWETAHYSVSEILLHT